MTSTPSVWDQAWDAAQPKLDSIRATLSSDSHSTSRPRIIRVGQLDSELLDQELAQLLQEPLNKGLSLINASLKAKFEPELSLLIQLVLYKLSVWNTGASYGAKLQDLRYIVPSWSAGSLTPSGLPRRTLLLHGTITLLFPYLHTRIRSHALSHAWPDAPSSDRRRKLWNLLNSLESIHTVAALLSFVAFLWNGRYRTIVDRLLRMSLVPSRRLVKRDVSYEFMNRQMVWHAFTEFLLFLLPLINARYIRRRFYRIAAYLSPTALLSIFPSKHMAILSHTSASSEEMWPQKQKRGPYWTLSEDECAICAENASFSLNVTEPANAFTSLANSTPSASGSTPSSTEPPTYPIYNPYITSCGHLYCYHCVAERMLRTADEADDESGWVCLRCSEEVKGAGRYVVEISESEVSGSDYDFSSDLDMDATDMSGSMSMGSYSESLLSE
ncbi:Pex12 amino terminal region-domain-containing protein [Crucibulum laeve]|uniref:RING-type E3 ubiquitin transferase (cysteine targeting) n=1 Tax=Crucibulum laeve TaxID=68775 RepID=A0A5C3MES1_9AGAR|nr:Pex12 amino terminal region-domain-containing protein [Crucibulum laeve]